MGKILFRLMRCKNKLFPASVVPSEVESRKITLLEELSLGASVDASFITRLRIRFFFPNLKNGFPHPLLYEIRSDFLKISFGTLWEVLEQIIGFYPCL